VAASTIIVSKGQRSFCAQDGRPRIVFTFTVTRGEITAIGLNADPDRFRGLDLVLLDRD